MKGLQLGLGLKTKNTLQRMSKHFCVRCLSERKEFSVKEHYLLCDQITMGTGIKLNANGFLKWKYQGKGNIERFKGRVVSPRATVNSRMRL